jgi:hypothetical protein
MKNKEINVIANTNLTHLCVMILLGCLSCNERNPVLIYFFYYLNFCKFIVQFQRNKFLFVTSRINIFIKFIMFDILSYHLYLIYLVSIQYFASIMKIIMVWPTVILFVRVVYSIHYTTRQFNWNTSVCKITRILDIRFIYISILHYYINRFFHYIHI